MPGGRTARQLTTRERKRQRILRAAIEVFAEKGYYAARMTDVAARAQVADGTLYLYFEGKEHLLISVFDDVLTRFIERVQKEIAELDDPYEKLRVMVRLHLETLGRDRSLAHILQIETRQSRRFMSLFTRGHFGAYLDLLQEILEEGQELGRFRRDINPRLATLVVFGAIDELTTSWLLLEQPVDLIRNVTPVLRLITEGLAPCEMHDA